MDFTDSEKSRERKEKARILFLLFVCFVECKEIEACLLVATCFTNSSRAKTWRISESVDMPPIGFWVTEVEDGNESSSWEKLMRLQDFLGH